MHPGTEPAPPPDEGFGSLFDAHMSIMLLIDPATGGIRNANRAACHFYGYAQAALCALSIDRLCTAGPEELALALQRALRGEQNRFVHVHRVAGGGLRTVEVYASPITLGGQQLLFAIIHDVTDRVQAEAALRNEQLRFAKVSDAIPGAICTFQLRPDGGLSIPYASKQFEDLYGLTLADVRERIDALTARVPPDQVAQLVAAVGESARTLQPWRNAYQYQHPLKGEIWLEGYSMPVREADGTILWHGFTTDITERRRAEEQLYQSEVRFRALIEHAPGAITLVGADGKLTFISASTERVMGYRPADMIGVDPAHLTHPEDLPALLALLGELIETPGQVRTTQYRFRHCDGSWRWVESTISNLLHEPSVGAIAINFQDITERKQAEQALLELNQTLEQRVRERTAEVQDLYENAPIGYLSLNVSGTVQMINQTLLDWLGYSREEAIGLAAPQFLTPASVAVFTEEFQIFKERGVVRDLELELLRKDGTQIPVLLSATAIYDGRSEYLMSRTVVFDNSGRKQAELALRESEAQNRLLFEESPDAVVLFHVDGRLAQLNRAFELLTGYGAAQLIGQTMESAGLAPREVITQLSGAVAAQIQASSNVVSAELRLRRASGEFRDVGVRVFGLKIRGRPHYLTTMRDITAEKQVAETLRQANAELAHAARMKDEFLANMSHELRTPLNAILGFSESLLEQIQGPLTARQQTALHYIETSGRHLLALINDILDLSKVEAGRLELQVEATAISQVCQSSLLFVKEAALKKELRLSVHMQDPLAVVMADPQRLKQMLVNLLSNAVKFTPSGGSVSLEARTDADAGLLQFVVQDSGIGIAPADLGRLFQPFSQLDPALNREYEGSGLGLALVRRLAELHGGGVAVESTPGRGSRFSINLPLRDLPPAAEPQDPPAHQDAAPPQAAHVLPWWLLLAEDNETNINAFSDYLVAKGYKVAVARDGYEALALADETRPHLILMDIQMPRLDGLETIRRLRALPAHAATPIIALTALAMPGDRERCLAAGANAYLTKPVRLRELAAMIGQLLHA